MRKLLLVLVLLGAVSSVYAEKGEMSYIPKIKMGKSKLNVSTDFGSTEEDGNAYGIGFETLYGVTENFEAGVGISAERNTIAKDFIGNVSDFAGEDLDESVWFGQLYLTGRYNFRNSTEFTPFVQAKAGLVFGGDEVTESDAVSSATLEIDPSMVFGLSTGVEYKDINLEVGYEAIKVDLTGKATINNVGSVEASGTEYVETIYVAVGYRF